MDPSGLEESPTWSGTKAFFWHFLAVGPYNLGAGAYGGIREVVYYTRDVVAVSADAVSTSVGYPLRVKEWSQCGLNNSPYHDRFWQNAAINAGRSGLGGLTVGASKVGIGVYDYTQTGDGAALQQRMGGVAAGNALAYASIRFGGRQLPRASKKPLHRAVEGAPLPHALGRVHGNSLASPRTAYLYRLEDASGNLLKWGVTQDMAKRYSTSFLRDKVMVKIKEGTRADMICIERGLIETQPGPLNLEPWAGSRLGELP